MNQHWSDTFRNLTIAFCQIAAVYLMAHELGAFGDWSFEEWLKKVPSELRKWHRKQEFELYYNYVWPLRKQNEPSTSTDG
jgi:hypothetical protein